MNQYVVVDTAMDRLFGPFTSYEACRDFAAKKNLGEWWTWRVLNTAE